MKIFPIENEAAVLLKTEEASILVIADLHIGIESELREAGLNIASQMQRLLNKVHILCEKYKPSSIAILGDVKHNIPFPSRGEKRDLKNFLEKLLEYVEKILIIPGNHDGDIEKFAPQEARIFTSKGIVIGDVGLVHGHSWPSEKVINCNQIIAAHIHPTIILKDRLGYTFFEPCWLKGKIDIDKARTKYKNLDREAEILFMPAFNPLCGGIGVNRDGIVGPIGKIVDLESIDVYLLDGTLLGKLSKL
jgi:hypothetical protein